MIRVLMEAGQAKTGDLIEVAGLQYRVWDVEHLEADNVKIEAHRGTEAVLTLVIDVDAQFEIVAPDQDGKS